MKLKSAHLWKPVLLIATVMTAACGGGGGGDGDGGNPVNPTTQTLSGIVAYPAIHGARVSVHDANGDLVDVATTSDENGGFTLTGLPAGDLADYQVTASGGIDTGTGENLSGIDLVLPVGMFATDTYDQLIISPLTTLVAAAMKAGASRDDAMADIAAELGLSAEDLALNPANSVAVMHNAMKVLLLRADGQAFGDIVAGLAGNDGIGENDLVAITDTAQRSRLIRHFALIDGAADVASATAAYQEALIRRTVRASLANDLAALETPDEAVINTNLHNLAVHLLANLPQGHSYLTADDVVATISSSGTLTAENLNAPAFDPSRFEVKIVDTEATFGNSLQLAFYAVENPLTGNQQLVVYDAANGTRTVVKTDIILGNRAFVFDGHTENGLEIYDSREYGILLDPNMAKETRTAPDGEGGKFEYVHYLDSALKHYDINTPANETLIFGSSAFPQALIDQGAAVLGGGYTLFNNISDAENSYVELKAFERLPDALLGESESTLLHGPVLVRMGDSAVTQGHMVGLIKGADGSTVGVLKFFEAIHKRDFYPEDATLRTRLQWCQPDLSRCDDITEAGGMGDGKFYLLGKNDNYLYLAKNGSRTLYAFDKNNRALQEVTGVAYPAVFDHKIHSDRSAAHGSGIALRSAFTNLAGAASTLSDGANAYVRINYDGDATDPVGQYRFFGDIHVYKHSQILKFTGTTGVKMFDNGDGIDHADESDAENVVGHVNLVAVANGRLFVEVGNYEAGNGGSCIPDDFGYYCSSVYYGYLNTGSTDRTELDVIMHPKHNLRYFVSRRIAPYALANRLYISTYVDNTKPYVFTLSEYDINNPGEPISVTTGRTYFTKTGQRANGIYEGTVLSWDEATGNLTNLSTGELMGAVQYGNSVIPGSPAINSVSGLTNGVPVAGIGNLFALKADPGGHRFYLVAGDVNETNGLEYVDQVPFSGWLYE